jgi:hypothetical protein
MIRPEPRVLFPKGWRAAEVTHRAAARIGDTSPRTPVLVLTCPTGPAVTRTTPRHGVRGPLPPSGAFARGVRGPRPPSNGGGGHTPRYPAGQPTATTRDKRQSRKNERVTIHDPAWPFPVRSGEADGAAVVIRASCASRGPVLCCPPGPEPPARPRVGRRLPLPRRTTGSVAYHQKTVKIPGQVGMVRERCGQARD